LRSHHLDEEAAMTHVEGRGGQFSALLPLTIR